MSVRLLKINKNIQRILGEIIQRKAEVPTGALVTIARVDTTGNLKSTTVWLYISPPQLAEKTLQMLKDQLYELQALLNNKLQTKPLPRIVLRLDEGAAYAQRIEETLAKVKSASAEELVEPTQSDNETNS